jgi:hypothetical protein
MAKVTISGLGLRTTSDGAGHVHGVAVGSGSSIDAAVTNLATEAGLLAEQIADQFQDSDHPDTTWQFEVVDFRLVAGPSETTGEAWACYGTLVSTGKHPWDPAAGQTGQ